MYQHILDKARQHAEASTETLAPTRFAERAAPAGRACGWPGCDGLGEHRAPKSRDALTEYHWFCLDHVRLYNKAWNYYAGMDELEVEDEIRRDTTWRRPSWPLGGAKLLHALDGIETWVRDFGLDGDAAARRARQSEPARPTAPTEFADALDVMGLDYPVDAADVKRCYKELVKRHHPDANGGSREAEETFKRIAAAYRVVMTHLEP